MLYCWTKIQGDDIKISDIYELEVATRLNGNMITWHDDLANPSSDMYKTLKAQLEPEVKLNALFPQ